MHIIIAGASGFVGQSLMKAFKHKENFQLTALKRNDLVETEVLNAIISQADVIINLSGANIVQRWSTKYKKVLYSSRIETTNALVSAINNNSKKQLLISASAIGIYEDEVSCDEYSEVKGKGFLADLCRDWEMAAKKVSRDKRLVIFRYGVVLAKNGGALSKMQLPFKLGLGGNIGTGEQAFSYIAMDDLIQAYLFVIENTALEGVFNLTTPHPTTNKIFSQLLGQALHRPAILHMPSFIVKLLFGEGSSVLLEGQKVYPKRLIENGFRFKYEKIENILSHVYNIN